MPKKQKKTEIKPTLEEKLSIFIAKSAEYKQMPPGKARNRRRAHLKRMKSSLMATPAPRPYLHQFFSRMSVVLESQEIMFEEMELGKSYWAIDVRSLEHTTRSYLGSPRDAVEHVVKEFEKRFGYPPEFFSMTEYGGWPIIVFGPVKKDPIRQELSPEELENLRAFSSSEIGEAG